MNVPLINEQEIRERFAPRACVNQMEFDGLMNEINTLQSAYNHPNLDKKVQINMERERLRARMNAIRIEMSALSSEYMEIDRCQKAVNRFFHGIKHELIMLNPRERFAKGEDTVC